MVPGVAQHRVLTAVPVVLVAFVLTWFLKEIEVRDHTGAEAPQAELRAAM